MTDPTPAASKKKILIIDDVAESRELAESVLKQEGFDVDVAPDAAMGGLKLLAFRPDLVVLDLIMPGIDGLHFLEYVRQSAATPPAVVVLSGTRTTESALRAVALGAFAFLPKPVEVFALVETCRAALSRPAVTPAKKAAERRAHPRRAVLVQVELVAGAATRGPTLGEMTELSVGGAAIISMVPLAVGAQVQLLPDPRVFHPSRPFVAVVRSSAEIDTGFRHGIEFVGLDPETERLLKENLAPASPSATSGSG